MTSGLVRRSVFLRAVRVAVALLNLAHRALVPAMMAARPAALNRLLRFFAGLAAAAALPLTLAHLARAPAAILARAAADMRRRLALYGARVAPLSPVTDSISLCSFSICSLIAMMRLS